MQMAVPKGRVNYEPSSLEEDSPRASITQGYESAWVAPADGTKGRVRPTSFQDHYSQARQYFISLTENEQAHLASALVFELGKVQTVSVRTRVLSRLQNVDAGLACRVADGLGMALPEPAAMTIEPIELPASPALSIQRQAPHDVNGKCIGVLFAAGSNAETLRALQAQVAAAGGVLRWVAPTIAGALLSDQSHRSADSALMAAPSVLFDAVAVVLSPEAGVQLAQEACACDWIRDAYAHLKAMALDEGGTALLTSNHLQPDAAVFDAEKSLDPFVQNAGGRFWEREARVRRLD